MTDREDGTPAETLEIKLSRKCEQLEGQSLLVGMDLGDVRDLLSQFEVLSGA